MEVQELNLGSVDRLQMCASLKTMKKCRVSGHFGETLEVHSQAQPVLQPASGLTAYGQQRALGPRL